MDERLEDLALADDVGHPPEMQFVDALGNDPHLVSTLDVCAAEILDDALHAPYRRPILAGDHCDSHPRTLAGGPPGL